MPVIKVAVIGVGYLGRYHAQKYMQMDHAQLIAVCDSDRDRAVCVAHECGVQTLAVTDYHSILGWVDAVSIATPVCAHYEIARFFLEHGVHVLLEKPMTATIQEADHLIELALSKNLILQIGHVEHFNAAIEMISGIQKKPHFIETHRCSIFQSRGTDANVIFDLMIHDIGIVLALAHSSVSSVRARGTSLVTEDLDCAHVHLEFDNGCLASLTANRNSAHKERSLRVVYHHAYFLCDLMQQNISEASYAIHSGISAIPHIEKKDPLKEEIAHFLSCIKEKKQPIISGTEGRNALELCAHITQKIKSHVSMSDCV